MKSGIDHYLVAVGSSASARDIKNFHNVGNITSIRLSGLNLSFATPYYISIQAVDLAGNISEISSGDGFLVFDSTKSTMDYVKATNTDSEDEFGASVAIDGNIMVVGAPGESSETRGINGDQQNNNAMRSGAVYVYQRLGNEWVEEAYLKASNADTEDEFGSAVAISGETIVVGAFRESSDANMINGDQASNEGTWSGAAYVFQREDGIWQ